MVHNDNLGFTLIELLIVVTIIGILAAVGIPSFLKWVPNMHLREAGREAFLDLQYAKTEAIKRNSNVVVDYNPVVCAALPLSVPDPGGNYLIFVDNGAGGGVANNNVQDGAEVTLKSVVMPQRVALCQTTFTGDRTGFLSTGLPIGSNIGTLTFNNDNNRDAALSLSISGNIRLQ